MKPHLSTAPRSGRWLVVGALGALLPTLALSQTASAQQELLQELRALKARVTELEQRLEAQAAQETERQQEFNRIAVKTEALEDSREMLGFKGLKISGWADPTYIANQRRHNAGFLFLDPVSASGYTYDDSYLGMAAIDFQKETDGGTRWRLTLAPQRSTMAVAEGSNSPIHEATVSLPLTDLQTRFLAGHVPDWSGYEYLQPQLNKLITHNLLFDLTLPTYYTGAGVDITRGKWWTRAMLANMNTSRRGNGEQAPVFTYRVDYAKGEFQGFGFAGVHGKAANFQAFSEGDSRVDLFEVDAYFIRGDWTVQGQLSFGRQKEAAIGGTEGNLRDAHWQGLSALVAHKFTPRLEGVARMDYIWNNKNGGGLLGYAERDPFNGIGTPLRAYTDAEGGFDEADVLSRKGVNRGALSLGLNYAYDLNTILKFEYRYDWATDPIFLDTSNLKAYKSNQVIGAAVVVSF
jgi:hypothetical protein